MRMTDYDDKKSGKTPLIEFINASYSYDTEEGAETPPAVKDVNFSISRGEFVAILGHNGSGKSTVAKMTNAILHPTKGKVIVSGMDTSDEALEIRIRQLVGIVFQNPDNQIVSTIVEEDVAFGPENLGVPPAEIRQRVDEALKTVGMYEYRLHEPHRLSGGQKQRVAIAGVLAMKTDCIVLDEPTAMLDPVGRKEVISTIKRLNKELGITVVLVTHFMDETVLADRIIIMNDGRIVKDGTPQEVFSDVKTIRETGLELPIGANLAERLRNSGINLKKGILTAEDFAEAFSQFVVNNR